MKVEQLCSVLTSAAAMNEQAGAKERAAALQDLAKVLKDHDKKTVSAFVKQTLKLANRSN